LDGWRGIDQRYGVGWIYGTVSAPVGKSPFSNTRRNVGTGEKKIQKAGD
jgi:hypothetical protein